MFFEGGRCFDYGGDCTSIKIHVPKTIQQKEKEGDGDEGGRVGGEKEGEEKEKGKETRREAKGKEEKRKE